MNDKELYTRILGLCEPWFVETIEMDLKEEMILIKLGKVGGIYLSCPKCGTGCPIYDHKERSWRHLDTCQLKTIIQGQVPRVSCPEHGVHQVKVPWAEENSSLTILMESLAISWLQRTNIKNVAQQLGLSWDQVDEIQTRAVRRGLSRRENFVVFHVGLDETSFQKRHEYVTIVMNNESGTVLEVLDGRTREHVERYFSSWGAERLEQIDAISMDMWPAFISAMRNLVPEAEKKICFDRFHVSQHLCNAVNNVRKMEHQSLAKKGKMQLKGTKYEWVKNSDKTDNRSRQDFMALTRSTLKTAKAWAMKETASMLWDYKSMTWAEKEWKALITWMMRSKMKPIKKVALMLRTHLTGILNAIRLQVNNAKAEGKNCQVQKLKSDACGFRNRQRFRIAILFRLGGLDLYPRVSAS